MAKKPPIPEVRSTDPNDYLFRKSVKDTLEAMTGVRDGQIAPLQAPASIDDLTRKVNEIVARINFG